MEVTDMAVRTKTNLKTKINLVPKNVLLYQKMKIAEKEDLIRQKQEYGRVICRGRNSVGPVRQLPEKQL